MTRERQRAEFGEERCYWIARDGDLRLQAGNRGANVQHCLLALFIAAIKDDSKEKPAADHDSIVVWLLTIWKRKRKKKASLKKMVLLRQQN